MKKLIDRLTPYLAGMFFPLLFAVQAAPDPKLWQKTALWMAVQILLLGGLELAGRGIKAGRSLTGAAGLWSVLFVQVFLRGLIRPSAIDLSVRIRAGFLLLCVIMVFVMILSACFGGNRPPSVGNNTLKLTLLMLIMPVALMIVGVFNRIFFFIGLGWGLLTLFVMFLRKLTDRNEPKPEADVPDGASQESALAVIGRRLSYLALAGVLVLIVLAAKQMSRMPHPAGRAEYERYIVYNIDLEAVNKAAGREDPVEAVLSFCTFEKQEKTGDRLWNYYKPNGIEAFLPRARSVGTITQTDGANYLWLHYDAEDGMQVTLDIGKIDEKEVNTVTVYDRERDVAFGRIGEEYYVWRHFRGGYDAPVPVGPSGSSTEAVPAETTGSSTGESTEAGSYTVRQEIRKIPINEIKGGLGGAGERIKEQYEDRAGTSSSFAGGFRKEVNSPAEAADLIGYEGLQLPAFPYEESQTEVRMVGRPDGRISQIVIETDNLKERVRLQSITYLFTEYFDQAAFVPEMLQAGTYTLQRYETAGGFACEMIETPPLDSGYMGITAYLSANGIAYQCHAAFLRSEKESAEQILRDWADSIR